MYHVTMIDMKLHLAQRFFVSEHYSGVVITDIDMTVLLWNLSGEICGYQVYNPNNPKKASVPREAKYFTHVTEGKDAVWGLETVSWNRELLFVTEGIFDAARLHSFGIPAIAVLGNNPSHLSSWLSTLSCKTIAAVQGDKAGLMLALSTNEAVFLHEGKDVGDLAAEEFDTIFLPYSLSSI